MSHLRLPPAAPGVPNYEALFALAPAAYPAWRALAVAVRDGMDNHRYELVTVAAARALGSRYCTLAHEAVLRDRFGGDEPGTAADAAAMDFAGRIARDPEVATAADIEALRAAGLTEAEIMSIVLAVCLRRFFAGVLSATGTPPDPHLEPTAPA